MPISFSTCTITTVRVAPSVSRRCLWSAAKARASASRFAVENGVLVASGVVSGTLVDENAVSTAIYRTVTVPVILPAGRAITGLGCDVLHLELGPLDLDLLGLVVHLDRVVLDITAVPGAGNLLGNLLCAIVGLLDGSNLGRLALLLNQLLDLLGGLLG